MNAARPQPGQEAYDSATGRVGILQAVCDVKELIFDPQMPGPLIAFLRPVQGGQEWTADPRDVTFPERGQPRPGSDDECHEPVRIREGTQQ